MSPDGGGQQRPGALEFREVSDSADDRKLLERFYRELYVPQFPDPDEREALGTIERYLWLKTQGWYGANNYHVLLTLDQGEVVAGSISDYLAAADAGVLEFLVVAPGHRGHGLASGLRARTEHLLGSDALERSGRPLHHVIAEMEDPFKVRPSSVSVDAFARTAIWAHWGYRRLDFPYVQPALSPEQRPVRHLMLLIKILEAPGDGPLTVPVSTVQTTIREYMRWAMRIPEPERSTEYVAMARALSAGPTVAALPLLPYVGRDPEHPLDVHEIADPDDPDLPDVLRIYREAFPPGPTAVDPGVFRSALREPRRRAGHARHLWAVRWPSASRPAAPVQGMASFNTFPSAGFGGYVAIAPAVHGSGRLRPLLARMEERMCRDDLGARGWYIECDPDGAQGAIFGAVGFREVAVTYRQPPLTPVDRDDAEATPRLRLMYKEFGRSYETPAVSREEFLAAVAAIYREIYGLEDARGHPLFVELARQVAELPGPTIDFIDGASVGRQPRGGVSTP